MNRPSSVHVLLPGFLLLSLFTTTYGLGKTFDASITNMSDKEFEVVVTDEKGHQIDENKNVRNGESMEWKIEKTTKETIHRLTLKYREGDDLKTVTIEAFKEEDEKKWLADPKDEEGLVFWNLKNDGPYEFPADSNKDVIYKTWEELDSEASANHRRRHP